MINNRETRFDLTYEWPVSISVNSIIEGQALVSVMENGGLAVAPSAGGASEKFMGIAFNQFAPQLSVPQMEEVTVGTGDQAKLTRKLTGNATNARAVVVGGAALTATTSTPASGEFKVETDGYTVSFHADQANAVVQITYRTDLTQREAVATMGSARQPAAPTATEFLGSTGVITRGIVVTSEYDPTANWAGGGNVKTGANGRFTLTGSAPDIANVVIVKAPSITDPNLTLLVK